MGGFCTKPNDIKPEDEEYGPTARRKCRDVLFLILFIAFWVGMAVVAAKGTQLGDPYRLAYGVDMYGNVCGRSNNGRNTSRDLTDKPVLYFPDVTDSDIQICIKKCPTEYGDLVDYKKWVCKYDVKPAPEELFTNCWPTYKSTEILNRCFPSEGVNATADYALHELNARELSSQVISDFAKSWKWICVCLTVAVVLGFVWLLLMRLFAGVIVWLTIIAAYGALIGITVFLWIEARDAKKEWHDTPKDQRLDSDERNMKTLEAFSWIFLVICVVMVLLLIWMRNRIRLAIGIIKEATKAIAAMPSIVFFPVLIFLMMLGFMCYCYLATAGTAVYNGDGELKGYNTDRAVRGMQLYHFFGFLWTTQFIIAIGQTTIAGAIAMWYWVRDKSQIDWIERSTRSVISDWAWTCHFVCFVHLLIAIQTLPYFPVLKALWWVFRYHLGSMAFGSLIIAIVKFIRAVLQYLQKKLTGAQNVVLKWFLRVLDCCFACLERFLKFLNKNAYIMIAIKGESFCTSAQRAFTLILSNILRVGTVGVISSFLLFLGKLFITMGATLLGIYLLRSDDALSFWVIPALVIALLSYFIASSFMNTYSMAIDTILLCFCEDTDRNDGNSKPYYMSDSLMEFVNSSAKNHPIEHKTPEPTPK